MKKLAIGSVAFVAVVLMGQGCSTSTKPAAATTDQARVETSAIVEETQRKLQDSSPLPQLTTSAERQNIVKRLETWDDENKVGYVYLVSHGKVMAFYPIKGKVSSLNSFLTPDEALVYGDGTKCGRNYSKAFESSANWEPCYIVSSPDLDGAYGENDGGIFFFTTEGAYVEWRGDYMFVDQPLKLTTPPELVREIK